jgi:hypothetical protein
MLPQDEKKSWNYSGDGFGSRIGLATWERFDFAENDTF